MRCAGARADRPHGRGGLTLACRLLPRPIRGDVFALYGVFRRLDDLVDGGSPDAERRVEAVDRWARGGRPTTGEAVTLQRLAARHPVRRDALRDFCRGMRHDLAGEVIETEEDLDRYCYRVAGTVGIVVAALLGTRRPCDAEAAALGIGLQRTNVLRDVEEDRAAGRVYLARDTLARFASPADWRGLVRDQVARAERHYDTGLAGLAQLQRGRAAVTVAAATYRELLHELARRPDAAAPPRVVVPTWRKLLVASRALAPAPGDGRGGADAAAPWGRQAG